MALPQLPNYLRANRKRLALSQDEVAFLLGAASGAKVSRYEQFAREPGLHAALAFEAIFRKPASELFAGLYQKIEKGVAARAKKLVERPDRKQSKPSAPQKRQALLELAGLPANKKLKS